MTFFFVVPCGTNFLEQFTVAVFAEISGVFNTGWLAIVREECKARTELVPAQALPFPESIYPAEPVQIRVGGAIVFVIPVDRFEKT